MLECQQNLVRVTSFAIFCIQHEILAAIHKSENKFGLHKSENKFGLHKSENKFGLHKSENKFGLHKSEKILIIFVVRLGRFTPFAK